MAHLLSFTFTPGGDPRTEAWSFRIGRTRQCGWLNGDLCSAARAALTMSWERGRRGVEIVALVGEWDDAEHGVTRHGHACRVRAKLLTL